MTKKHPPRCVFPEWMFQLPMQQQSVLVLALRGPDNIRKDHPCKDLQRVYRGTVLKAALYGRSLQMGERADTFMDMTVFMHKTWWREPVQRFRDSIDELPHHYIMHMMHGAQILGYKHPNPDVRDFWHYVYLALVNDAHLNVEYEEEMDNRLNDWNQDKWENEE